MEPEINQVNPTPAGTSPQPRQVMDITPGPATRQQPSLRPEAAAPVATEQQQQDQQVQEAPVQESTGSSEPSIAAEKDPEVSTAAPAPMVAAAHEKTSHGPLIAIVVAVLVAVALATVAVLMYQQSNQQPAISDSPANQAQQSQASVIDAATSDIDAAIQAVNDDSDLQDDSISDATLGL